MGNKYVGQPIPQIDSDKKVTGTVTYAFDIELPGMLWAKLVTSTEPHAKIKKVDFSRAEQVPGVVATATGKDFPYRLGIYVGDRDVLAVDKVLWVGHPVAAVIAESLEAAERASELVDVEYEPLPPVFDVFEALKPNAPILHEKLGEYRHAPIFKPQAGTNIANTFHIIKGDIEEGFREAELVFEDDFKLPHISHAYMETQSTVAHYHPDRTVEVWTSSQSPFAVRSLMAASLNMPVGKLIVYSPNVGGGFGGKAGIHWEPLVALLSKKADYRPVKLMLSRKEQFTSAPGRSAVYQHVKAGFKKDGKLVAWQSRIVFDSGGYADYTVNVSRAAGYSQTGVYDIPHIHAESIAVYTNKVPTTALRGFGHTESQWTVERVIDMAAHRLGIDPVQMRLRNLLKPGLSMTATGAHLRDDAGNPERCLKAVTDILRWNEPARKPSEPWLRIGRGVAAVVKGPSQPTNASSSAIIKFNEDCSVDVLVATGSFGQGTPTSLAQIVADELDLPIENVRIGSAKGTDSLAYTWQTVGSRGLFADGNALLDAINDAKQQMKEVAAQVLRARPDDLAIGEGKVFVKSKPWYSVPVASLVMGYTYEDGSSIGGPIIGRGKHISSKNTNLDPETGQGSPSVFYTFGVTGVEVEVNVLTGEFHVLKAVQAFDVGKAINPLLVKTQMDGGFNMGLSVTRYEELLFDEKGWVMNPNLTTYYVARATDLPGEIHEVIVETPQSDGPYGARGIGEMVMMGVPSAISNAVYNAAGVEVRSLPLTPENLWRVIKEQKPELIQEAKRAFSLASTGA